MECYSAFAAIYDRMMENIPYDAWCTYVTEILARYGVEDGLVCELGCGTGNLTERFAGRGYDMIGIDNSEDMLSEAMEKRMENGLPILYLQQDIRSFELYGTVAAIVSLCDTMNYITSKEDLVQVFRLANNYLDPDGLFVLDLKTRHYFEETVGSAQFSDLDDDYGCIWQNAYDEETGINQYLLTIFLEQEEGVYERFEELHEQRSWTLDEMKDAASAAGMLFMEALDDQGNAVTDTTDRMYLIFREHGKGKE